MILDAFANFRKETGGFVISVRLFVSVCLPVCLSVYAFLQTEKLMLVHYFVLFLVYFFLLWLVRFKHDILLTVSASKKQTNNQYFRPAKVAESFSLRSKHFIFDSTDFVIFSIQTHVASLLIRYV
jgi:hypothetical protein